MSLRDAVGSGDRREALEALRDTLARAIDGDPDGKLTAPLANQLRQVLAELADIPDVRQVSKLDDLAARRSSRRATASGQ